MNELLEGLQARKFSVITVSPQSVSSLAVRYQISSSEMAKRISTFFKSKGAAYVIDSSFARLITHKLVAQELLERFKNGVRLPLISRFVSVYFLNPNFVLF